MSEKGAGDSAVSSSEVFEITEMDRGGILVTCNDFLLQIGVYPETIKDSMKTRRGVPDLFLLPEELFDLAQGISAADIEFPAYYNFFVKGRKLRFICRRHQLRILLRVLRESVFGPQVIETEKEFIDGKNTFGYPDLRKEMNYYKINPELSGGKLRLKHIVEPYVFDENGQVVVDGVKISIVGFNRYRLEKNTASREVHLKTPTKPEVPLDILPAKSEGFYEPPVFGITVIGSGHGFDAATSTSGFIIWIDGKGVLVDSPVNSTAWLKENRINTRLIEHIILTHCHADHDAGTLEKILEEGRIKVHTTRTIMRSFITKYRSLTGLNKDEFMALFSFNPVHIGQPISIIGGEFLFKYSLHSIPTIGLNVTYQGKSIVYSSDTLYDPPTIRSLQEKGIISQDRMEDLLNFPWNGSVVFHEAGLPPIHTPIEMLANLPDQVKEHLYLVHVSESSIPPDKGLKLACPGVANTISIDVPRPETSLAYKMLDVMAHIDLFRNMSVDKAPEFLDITRYEVKEPGEVLIKRDTEGDRFYMILSGEVEIMRENMPQRLIYSRYDYIGEMALVLDRPRSADVVARTRVELLYIKYYDFLRFIRDTSLKEDWKRLAENRDRGARWLFQEHSILKSLSPLQKNQLMCIMRPREIPGGTYLFRKNTPVHSYFWLDSGEVAIKKGEAGTEASRGALLGEFDRYLKTYYYSSDALAETDVSVYQIPAGDLRRFFRANPGTYLRMLNSISGGSHQSDRLK